MTELPLELLALPPLALAAGVDLYLTLLFIGAAPTTGLGDLPLPGALGDLDSPGVLIMVGAFYIAEFTAERFPSSRLVWNAFHAVIRPVSGVLLALLVLDGQPLPIVIGGSALGGLLASIAHGVRTGAWVLRGLSEAKGPAPVLISLAEDVVVLGGVSLALDEPGWALGASLLALVSILPIGLSRLRAFAYGIRLGVGRIFRPIGLRRWRRTDELPGWIRYALRDDEEARAHGEALRGCPAGAWGLEGAPKFAVGWIVVRGGRPRFVFQSRGGPTVIDLGERETLSVRDGDLYRRIDLEGNGVTAFLLVGWSGPSTASLTAEFTPS